MGYRQHGNVRILVVLVPGYCQRPEMWRRPGKNDQEQQQRVGVQAVAHGSPAEHRRRRARGPADHDILRRGAFQEHGIDHAITNQRDERQKSGQCVHENTQDRHGYHTEDSGENLCLPRGKVAFRQGPFQRARHNPVNFLVDDVVYCRRGRRRKTDAQGCADKQGKRHHAGRSQQHAHQRGKHDQANNFRFA